MKKRIAILLAGATMASAILAGCSGAKKEAGSGDSGSTDTSSNVKQELTINLGEEPPSLDSAKVEDTVGFDVLTQTNEGLVRIGEGGKILEGVAEKWTVSEDGLVYTFNLRKNAKWSDGKPVTAKDFKFGWLRALDPKIASTYAFQLYYIVGAEEYNTLDVKAADFEAKAKELKDKIAVETPDDYTLKVTLKNPTPYFLGLMATTTFFPQREDVVTQHGEKYATSADTMLYNGPFSMESWTHEDNIVLKKNANYWDAGAVKLDTVNFKMIKDTNTAVQMFEAGELDWTGLTGEFIPRYKDKGITTIPLVSTWYLTMNTKSPATGNLNIRKAINLALDRKGFTDNVLKNGSISAEGLVPGSVVGADGKTFREISGSLIPQAVNKDEAKKYFEAGLKELGQTKLELVMLSSDSAAGKRYAQGIQEMLQSNLPGLTVTIEPVAFKVRLERQKAGQFDMAFAGWSGDYNDPMTYMEMWISGSAQNDAKWENKAYDELIAKAKVDGNMSNRMKAMAEAEKIIADQLPIIPIYHPTVNRVFAPGIKNVLQFPLGASWDLKGVSKE